MCDIHDRSSVMQIPINLNLFTDSTSADVEKSMCLCVLFLGPKSTEINKMHSDVSILRCKADWDVVLMY